MENSTDSMSDLDYKSLVNQCLEMCSALKDKGCKFSLSLRLGSSFNFSLSSEGCSPPEATQKPRRSPSYLRRQTLRRAAFLQRKKKPPLAEETASTGNDNNVCRQEGSDLLDKKVASSGQTAQKEDETVDKDCPLNLNPTPSYPRESEAESEESEDDYDEDAGSEGRSDATGRDSAPEIKKQEEVEPSREGHSTTVTSRRSGEQRSPIANSNNRGQPSPALSQPPHRIIRIKDAWTNQYGQSGRKNRDHFFTPHVSVYAPADATDAEVAAAVHSVDKSRLRFISGIMCYEFCRESGQFLGNSAIKKLMMANSLPDYVELQNEFLAIQQKHKSK